MKHFRSVSALWLLGVAFGIAGNNSSVTLFNPLRGADSDPSFAQGNSYPAT
jgi:hypothetical protein